MTPDEHPEEISAGRIDPTALTVVQAAKLLGVAADVISRHIADGLPTGPGGTVNLITYAAWLNLPEGGRDEESET